MQRSDAQPFECLPMLGRPVHLVPGDTNRSRDIFVHDRGGEVYKVYPPLTTKNY